MKIGDKVAYAEENEVLEGIYGEIVEPTETEVTEALYDGVSDDVVMVAWNDGRRFWEDPGSLVEVNE